MAFNVQNDLMTAADITNYVNNYTNTYISSRIDWGASNVPSDMVANFNFSELLQMAGISKDTVMTSYALYNAIQNVFSAWGSVRVVRLIIYKGNNTNGGSVTYSLVSDSTKLGRLKNVTTPSITGDGFEKKNQLIKGSDIINYMNQVYARWQQLPSQTLTKYRCHSNCHSSCHGSGGFR